MEAVLQNVMTVSLIIGISLISERVYPKRSAILFHDQIKHCLTSLSVRGPVFQCDVAVRPYNEKASTGTKVNPDINL